ncbi:hypothetical protein JNUCC0626_26500 [Lentzea sp. JNUCC 0626]|uniref:hypothetical protein n=1 Tax=Lentzea sp. JNUCC 0626 TaxID=3367513 RepID=UPI003748DFD7
MPHSPQASERALAQEAPTSHWLRKSLNKAAFLLAAETGRHPGSVNVEVNRVMGVERRAEASRDQLRRGLKHVGDQLRALTKATEPSTASSGDPPF